MKFFYLLKYSDVYEKKVIRFHVLKNEKNILMQVAMERSLKLLPSHKTCLAVPSLSIIWKSELLEEVSTNSI